MKPLSAITGRIEDMDSTVLSLTEFAHLTKQLEALNAENADLRAQLEAIGAGGVEPLRKRGCLHQIEEPLGMVAR